MNKRKHEHIYRKEFLRLFRGFLYQGDFENLRYAKTFSHNVVLFDYDSFFYIFDVEVAMDGCESNLTICLHIIHGFFNFFIIKFNNFL